MNDPSALTSAVPFCGAVTSAAVRSSSSGSLSLVSTPSLAGTSSTLPTSTTWTSSVASGGRFGTVTSRVKDWVSMPPRPSSTRTTMSVGPASSAVGSQVIRPVLGEMVAAGLPSGASGPACRTNVSVSPSGSVAAAS